MVINQAYLFLIFTLVGAIIGFIFDFFRILRRSFKTNNIVTYIQDIIFWLLTGFIILISIFIFNNGEIRFFMFIGLLLGIIFYLLLFSKYIVNISVKIVIFIKKLIIKIYNLIKLPFKYIFSLINTIFYKPFKFIIINLSTKILKFKQFCTKFRVNKIKKCKNHVNN